MSGTVHLEREGAVAFLVIDNPPVNAGSAAIRRSLLAAIGTVEADPDIEVAVLIGAGRSFIAGSDLKEFDLPLDPPQLPAVIAAIENAGKPFVAALHGAALGGGYELALGCDARIAAPGTSLGLPETTLGIIPGAGGTQKLPRLTGIAKAIELICSGRRVPAEQAVVLGMIDAVAEGDLRADAARLALNLGGRKQRVMDRPVRKDSAEAVASASRKAMTSGRGRPHIAIAIRHIKASAGTPSGPALVAERADFESLRVGDEARALRYIFFAEREAVRGRRERTAKPLPYRLPGIVGAGTMGIGIATAMLTAGYPVTLVDSNEAVAQQAGERITALLERAAAAGRLSAAAMTSARERITVGASLEMLAGCDFVVEAVIEDIAAKRAVFSRLDALLDASAVLASNTSYLDIDEIASATARPHRVVGLHFFSPANIMKLVEVIAGCSTSDEAMATGLSFAKALGKLPVEAGNGFGFIGNRVYTAYRASCEFMLEDGALPHEVDAALEAFGFAMGPFAVADVSGLDIAWHMRRQQAPRRDPHSRYVHIPDKLCEAGRLGRKTDAGYYRYREDGGRERDPDVEALIVAESAAKGIERKPLTGEQIRQRALAAIVNEAGLVIEDNVALRPSDIDVVLVNGYGFPRWRGGPLHWARHQDAAALAAQCGDFVAASGAGRRRADLVATGIVGSQPSAV